MKPQIVTEKTEFEFEVKKNNKKIVNGHWVVSIDEALKC